METKCRVCGKPLGSFETIHVAGEGPRCYPCFNRKTADRLVMTFEGFTLEARIKDTVQAVGDPM